MKKITIETRRLLAAMLGGVVTLFGFNSCKHKGVKEVNPEPSKIDQIMLMYGTPFATYNVAGKILDSDGKPVKDARVTLRETTLDGTSDLAETVSDAEGHYGFPTDRMNGDGLRVVVTPKDDALRADSIDIDKPGVRSSRGHSFDFKLKRK